MADHLVANGPAAQSRPSRAQPSRRGIQIPNCASTQVSSRRGQGREADGYHELMPQRLPILLCKAKPPLPQQDWCIGFGYELDDLPGNVARRPEVQEAFLAGTRCDYCQGKYTRKVLEPRELREEKRDRLLKMVRHGKLGAEIQREWTEYVEEEVKSRMHSMWARMYDNDEIPRHALCFTGSLARREASPNSDVDCFLLLSGESLVHRPRFLTLFTKMNRDFKLIERKGIRFCEGGLAPYNELIVNTPDGLKNFMAAEAAECARSNTPDHYASIREGRFVSGDRDLFKEFAALMMQEDASGSPREMLAKMQYFLTNRDQNPPPIIDDGVHFDAKQTLYRPLQMILTYLCGYYATQGAHADEYLAELDSRGRLACLVKRGKVSMQVAALFINSLEDVSRFRIESHLLKGTEDDDIAVDELTGAQRTAATQASRNVTALWDIYEAFLRKPKASPSPFLHTAPLQFSTTVTLQAKSLGLCQRCAKKLHVGFRHHCRSCGKLVCGACSKKKVVLRLGRSPERVCDPCAGTLIIRR